MKKYLVGFLAIAVLMGGVSLLDKIQSAHATVVCHSNGEVFQVGDPHPTYPLWKCQADGTWGLPVGSIDNDNSSSWANALASAYYANAISWTNTIGNVVSPKSVSTRTIFIDENGTQIYLIGGDATKVSSLIKKLTSIVDTGDSGAPGLSLDACFAALHHQGYGSCCQRMNSDGTGSGYFEWETTTACQGVLNLHSQTGTQ